MDIKDKKHRRSLFLYYAGEEVNDIFETFQDTGDDYKTSKNKADRIFCSKEKHRI
jgi:hypothetical protein